MLCLTPSFNISSLRTFSTPRADYCVEEGLELFSLGAGGGGHLDDAAGRRAGGECLLGHSVPGGRDQDEDPVGRDRRTGQVSAPYRTVGSLHPVGGL